MIVTENQISGKVLDHLGLVASTIDQLGLIDKLDQRIPLSQEKGAKTTIGQRVSAMILNGLGFINTRLYLFPEFLHNKPVDRLMGKDLKADDFNDDALGRCLDKIYEYGVTKLFSEVAFDIGIEKKLLGRSLHFDTSTLSVYGDYLEDDDTTSQAALDDVSQTLLAGSSQSHLSSPPLLESRPTPKHGYSKDHRPDLKQMVINLATTGSAGFPVWMEAHSGNAADSKIIHESAQRMKSFSQALKEAPDFLVVGDSALYDSCTKSGGDTLFLTRVPERHKAVKDLLGFADENYTWSELGNGYKICIVETKYRAVHQRWGIVFSEQAYKREMKTLEKNIGKDLEAKQKELLHLGNKEFKCEADAQKALDGLHKSVEKGYHLLSTSIEPILRHKRGRPCKGAVASVAGYQVRGTLSKNEDKIAHVSNSKGRFVLATNQMNRKALPDEELLSEYKEQSKVEKGFRFLKNTSFEVATIFLKKPERISALMMVMTLCLMVHSFAEHNFRKALKAANDTIANQLKKETDRPSMQWIYSLFHGVQVVTLNIADTVQEIVTNLNDTLKKIIRYFGRHAMHIYGVT